MAHDQENVALGPGPVGPSAKFFLAMSHEPRAMSHEPSTIDNRWIIFKLASLFAEFPIFCE